PITPARISDVGVRAWIDEHVRRAPPGEQAQGIGMAVAASPWSERAGVEDDLHVVMGHDDHAGVWEKAGFGALRRCWIWRWSVEPPCGLFVKGLGIADPGWLIAHYAASSERGARKAIAGPVGMEESSAVVVPQHRQGSCNAHQRLKVFGHPPQLACEA